MSKVAAGKQKKEKVIKAFSVWKINEHECMACFPEEYDLILRRPRGGGCVWYLKKDGTPIQICERLRDTGKTLSCGANQDLTKLIKREMRKYKDDFDKS